MAERPPEGPDPADSAWVPPEPPPPPGYGPPPPGYGPPGYRPPPEYGPQPGYGPPPKAGGARTGPLPLHPMTVGDILDGIFKLFKANAATIVTIVALITVPLQLVAAWTQRDAFSGAGLFDVLGDPSVVDAEFGQPFGGAGEVWIGILLTFAGLLTVPFLAGAISQVVAASYLGQTLPAGPALTRTLRRFWALVGGWFVCHLPALFAGVAFVVLLLAGGGAAGAVAGPGVGSVVLAGFFALVVFVPAVLAVSTLSVAVAPAIVVEELGPVAGVRRSWGLVRHRFWSVMGISLLAGLLTSLVGGALGFIPSVVALAFGLEYGWIVLAVGGILASLVSEPIVAIAATLIYFDLRIRTEGFDLQVIATELSRQGPSAT